MHTIFQFCYRFAYGIIALCLLLTGLATWQAREVRISVSSDELIPRNSPLLRQYERIRAAFGSDELALVYVRDPDLFSFDKLTTLRELANQLATIPEVQRVESLFSVNNISGSGGMVDTSPLLQSIPRSPGQLAERKALALKNPLLVNNILSEDGTATLILLYLKPADPAETDFDKNVYQAIESIIHGTAKKPEPVLPDNLRPEMRKRILAQMTPQETKVYPEHFTQVYQVGSPALHVWMADYILDDQKILLPLAGFILLVLIGLLMGNFQSALMPLVNALIATAWTLAIMALLGIPVTMLSYIVPALILIIGATEDVHILAEYRAARESGLDGQEAVAFIPRHIGLTLVLTALTTVLGFAATGLSSLTIMQQFGTAAAIGMFTRFTISILLVPAWLRLGGKRMVSTHSTGAAAALFRQTQVLSPWMMKHCVRHKWRIILLFAFASLPALLSIPRMEVGNDLISFLKDDSMVRQKLDQVADTISGSKVIYVTINSTPGDFRESKKLRQLEQVTAWLRQDFPFDSVVSLSDYIALVNQAFHGDDPGQRVIPDNDALIAQYLLFFHRSNLEPYVTSDFSSANIAIRCNVNNSTELNRIVAEIRETLRDGRFGPLVFTVSGKSVIVASSVDQIVKGQVLSLSTILGFLILIIGLLFISVKAAGLAALSNLFPIIILFGLMGIFQIPLNIGTCMVAAITISIAVDDTLHLMVRYNKELKRLKNEYEAIAASMTAEVFPVITTSIGLAGGFLVLGFSSFIPVMQFGLLSALVMVLALIADLLLTPVLLSTIRLITLWDLIGFKLRESLLDASPVFAGLTHWQAKKLILLADLREYQRGEAVIREGEIGDTMYVVLDGEVEVSRTVNGEHISLSLISMGGVVGEVALVSRIKRTADVIATQPCKVLALDWESLVKLQRTSPFLSSRLFLNLSRILGFRLRDSLGRIDSRAPFPKDG